VEAIDSNAALRRPTTNVTGTTEVGANHVRRHRPYPPPLFRMLRLPSYSTPMSLFEALAKDKTYRVREVVAENGSTSLDVLEAPAKDR
jgi:hypothetical protein